MKPTNNRWMIPIIIFLSLVLLGLVGFLFLLNVNVYTVQVTLSGDPVVTVEYGDSFRDPGASAVYFGTIFQQEPLDVPVTAEGIVDVSKIGDYVVHYYAEHEGVSGSETRTVRVVDTVAPEIALLGEETVTLPVGEEFQDPGCAASDNYNGELSDSVTVTGELDPAAPGTYILTYHVADESGNTAQVTRRVIYVDVTAPVITLLGDTEMELDNGSSYEEPGFTAVDDCDGDITQQVTVEGAVNTDEAGTYTLTYTVADAAGNSITVVRTVTVKDMVPPELTLYGDSVVRLVIGNAYSDPGYSALDNCDGDLTGQVEVVSEVNMYLPGTYTVTYSVTDASGNTATASRTVVMEDIQARVSGGVIYLTYDDGPSSYTSRLLEILDRYGVKATFFVVNTGYASVMTEVANAGHTIGIHSTTHDFYEIYASEEAFFNDLYRMQNIIASYTGLSPVLIRFPGGSSNTISYFNPGIMSRLCRLVEEKGFRYFDWNVDSRDAGGVTHGWAEVAYNVIRGVSNRSSSVVLMHDSHGTCLKATERIIQWGLANGYTFAVLNFNSPGAHHGINN